MVSRAELVALSVLGGVLLAGVALTVLTPAAWPVPVAVTIGTLAVAARLLRRARRSTDDDAELSAEAAAGVREIESWLAQRDKA